MQRIISREKIKSNLKLRMIIINTKKTIVIYN